MKQKKLLNDVAEKFKNIDYEKLVKKLRQQIYIAGRHSKKQFTWKNFKKLLNWAWKGFKWSLYSLFVLSLVALLIGIIYVGNYVNKNVLSIKSINKLELTQNPNSEIYADDGATLIWTDSEYQHRASTKENTPDVLLKLLISTEDNTFYENEGFSPKAIANTVYTSLLDKVRHTNTARGGSTITQQLVKNIRYLNTNLSDYDRKVQEVALAGKMTDEFSKDEILYAYLNKVGFLESSYGFNTAMYLLYGEETSKEKTDPVYLAKYATIVGMLKNPSLYNPRNNPEGTQNRRNQVLKNAYDQKAITKEQYDAAKNVPINQDLKDQGWFTQQVYETATANGAYVNSILKQIADYGYDIKNKEHPIKVISNLNIAHNEWLQAEVAKPEHYANERQQIAITVVEPGSGKVLAQVGSRNGGSAYDLNRATQVTRSSGSTIKPFLDYAPLIEFSNVTENTMWNANTTSYAGTNVIVRNYGNFQYGSRSTTDALKLSLNVPAVDALARQEPWMNQTIMNNLKLEDHQVNEQGNIDTITTFGGSQALGIHESTADFASAFGALANNGVAVDNMYVKSITQDGQTVELSNNARQAMSPRTASKLLSMLETTLQPDGSAKSAAIPEYKGYSVKTGTVAFDLAQPLYYDQEHTQYAGTVAQVGPDLIASDQWMSGTTKSVSVSVWTGFDDQAIYGDWISPENQARSALLVNTMKHFNEGKDTSQFNFDQSVVELAKKENVKSMAMPDNNKISPLINPDGKMPSIVKNDVKASKDQKKLQKDFEENKLTGDYTNIKPYYDINNPLAYALYKSNKGDSTGFYTINSYGQVVGE